MDLNAEQKRIATLEPRGHQLLKGVAGSGKTSVGLYRVHFLLNNYCFGKDDAILLATYNRTLIKYMAYLYGKMAESEQGELSTLFDTPNRKVDIKTVDSLMVNHFDAHAAEHKEKFQLSLPQNKSYQIISEGITKLKKNFPDVGILNQKNTGFLLQEINWIKDCLYLEEEEYQGADRKGMVKSQAENKPQRLQKNSPTRKAIFELMRFYDQALRKMGKISFSGMRIRALEQARKAPQVRYTHVIIDESQDLTRSQLLFLKAICNQKEYSSFVFIADTAQNIYPQSWLGSGNSFASIGFSMQGRSHSLSKNYRTTTQISKAAYSLIEHCAEIVEDENYVKPALIDKHGVYPVCKQFSDERSQADYLAAEIKRLTAEHDRSDMVILGRFKRQLDQIKTMLAQKGIACSDFNDKDLGFDSGDVKLITLHSIKGLEFPIVFMVGLNEGVIPYLPDADEEGRHDDEVKERKLFYVGMTRATEKLYMLSSGKGSPFLMDIAPRLTRIDSGVKMRRFYNVAVDDFRFKGRITNIHGAEEKVRQWILAELVETYKYPLANIAIEYPVKAFSKTGYVDIAVHVNRSGSDEPFLFVETKRRGHSLEDACEQVRSYMNHCPPCEYAAVTDGMSLRVMGRQGNPVNDLPEFREMWALSNSVQVFFHHLKRRQKAQLCFDPNDPTTVEVDVNGMSKLLKADQLEKIPLYGSIAAGQPIHMNSELDETFYLPKAWVRGADYFALKVRGDSMVGAGIDNGDTVLVRSQPTADNLDIVVAALNEDATLKRFSKMGDNAILQAENPNYDPILLSLEQLQILGIAVGVVKNGIHK